jgi:hypothetical protein
MAHTPKYKEMTTASWMGAFCTLHSLVKNGVLDKGSLAQMACLFSVSWSKMNLKNCFTAKLLLLLMFSLTLLAFFFVNRKEPIGQQIQQSNCMKCAIINLFHSLKAPSFAINIIDDVE